MSIDDELNPEPVTCPLCLGYGSIDVNFDGEALVCPDCDGEGWVMP